MSGALQPSCWTNSSNFSQTTTSPFLSLPLEIRLNIYHHLFIHTSVAFFPKFSPELTSDYPPTPQNSVYATTLAILTVNKQVHTEALPLFYSLTSFSLRYRSCNQCYHEANAHSHAPDSPTWDTFPVRADSRIVAAFARNPIALPNVSYLTFRGSGPKSLRNLTGPNRLFTNLKCFELDLGADFFHSDQTNFDRAVRNALRYGEWKCVVKTALDDEHRFDAGMRDALVELKMLGREKRGFAFKLRWVLEYRFVTFEGCVDLDEWVLRVWDPDGNSNKLYKVPQNQLEPTWCEGRLTLPQVASWPEAATT